MRIDGLDDLERTVNQLANMKRPLEAEIVKTLSTIRNKILRNTTSGYGLDNSPLKPYSKNYQILRSRNNRQASPVSLTWTGNMLRAMKVFSIKNGGEIKFDSTRANDLAVRHNSGQGVPKREFFGLSKENLDYIEKKLAGVIPL